MAAVRRPGQPNQRMMLAMLFWTVPASFLVSLLLALVQLAINVHDDVTGKSIGPIVLVWVSAPVVLPMAVAAGYLVVRVWTAAAWLAMARSAGPTAAGGEAFTAARGLCLQTAVVYTAGLAVLASLLVAGSAEFGVLSRASQAFQAALITAGPTGALAPVALLAVAAVRHAPSPGERQPASRRLVLVRATVSVGGAVLWCLAVEVGLADRAIPGLAQLAVLLVAALLPAAVIVAIVFMGPRRTDGVKRMVPGWPTAVDRGRPLRRRQAGSLAMVVLLSVGAIAYSALIGLAVAPLLLSSAGGKIIGALVVSAATVPAGAIVISQGTARSLRE